MVGVTDIRKYEMDQLRCDLLSTEAHIRRMEFEIASHPNELALKINLRSLQKRRINLTERLAACEEGR